MDEQQQDIFYSVENFSYECLLSNIAIYLSDKDNPTNDELLSIFNSITVLFSDFKNRKTEYSRELETDVYNLMDKLGFYDDVKNKLMEGLN